MIYRSNLTAPEIRKHFRLCDPPRMIAGHDAPSDPDYDSSCLFMTDDEATILHSVASRQKPGAQWVDIGSRFGWSAAHVAAAGHYVTLVDPHFKFEAYQHRMETNLGHCWSHVEEVWHEPWRDVEDCLHQEFDGFVIDGCHDAPEPLRDAQGCARLAADTAVILLHDAMGKPVRDAAAWLMDNGWKGRFYWTPNGIAVCWRGNFTPPDHVRDPAIDWAPHERVVYADIARERWA